MDKRFWIRVLVGALVVFAAGMIVMTMGRRAKGAGETFRLWADSLEHGSGPVAMEMPLRILPVYLEGERVGRLDSIILLRHSRDTVEGLRVVLEVRDAEARARLEHCVVAFGSFEHFNPKQAFRCVDDTTGLVRFGELHFLGDDARTPLFISPADLAEGPWVPADSTARALREELRLLKTEIRESVRQSVREAVRQR